MVSLADMKNYLRVDTDDDDNLIQSLLNTANQLCLDILRKDDLDDLINCDTAVMYATSFMYEHRAEADYHALELSLRALLHGSRNHAF